MPLNLFDQPQNLCLLCGTFCPYPQSFCAGCVPDVYTNLSESRGGLSLDNPPAEPADGSAVNREALTATLYAERSSAASSV